MPGTPDVVRLTRAEPVGVPPPGTGAAASGGDGEVVYTGTFHFPQGNVAAGRVLGIGKALREWGFRVRFAGFEADGRPEDRQADEGFCYDGFQYVPESRLTSSATSRWRRAGRQRLGSTTLRRLSALDLTNVRAIVAYNAPSALLLRLSAFCRRHRLACIADTTEWYDFPRGVGRWCLPVWADSELRMRLAQPRLGHVLAISSFLRDYYQERGCRVLRIPPLVDARDAKWNENGRELPRDGIALNIAYAGTPGQKETFASIVGAVAALSRRGRPIVLHVIGPTRVELAEALGTAAPLLEAAGRHVICYGRLPHSEVVRRLQRADFSVFVRPVKRSTQAGFPTKLVESLAAGLPVITNATSDIGEYVRDGHEGILLEDTSAAAVEAGLRRALDCSTEQRQLMQARARERATVSFDYRLYAASIGRFVTRAIEASA